eukprot:TRINITY_DN18161_c0_g1_i3.p2 TRINITY_DN18161_c0_g1~~TRINITY_DN18161_c0_g1_i3.p2  ORF type:complete len:114 (+),score=7.29 TRINITY_DN18161_c0_g1_i3:329-670(+)
MISISSGKECNITEMKFEDEEEVRMRLSDSITATTITENWADELSRNKILYRFFPHNLIDMSWQVPHLFIRMKEKHMKTSESKKLSGSLIHSNFFRSTLLFHSPCNCTQMSWV